MPTSKPGQIHRRMIEIMKRFPDGVSGGQLREELEKEGLRAAEQTHLDRRKRDLKKWFVIDKITANQVVDGRAVTVTLYQYKGERGDRTDEGEINIKVRAAVLHAAHGRCQMCGKTIDEDGIKLVVDHKKPRAWGGTNDRQNLQALCEACNAGKKSYFSSFAPEFMKQVMGYGSVHVRIGETLKATGVGKRTPPEILEVVADQEDWHKRLRELRYPVIGWDVKPFPYVTAAGRKRVDYILMSYRPWPENPTAAIRQFERERERQNRTKETDGADQESD